MDFVANMSFIEALSIFGAGLIVLGAMIGVAMLVARAIDIREKDERRKMFNRR